MSSMSVSLAAPPTEVAAPTTDALSLTSSASSLTHQLFPEKTSDYAQAISKTLGEDKAESRDQKDVKAILNSRALEEAENDVEEDFILYSDNKEYPHLSSSLSTLVDKYEQHLKTITEEIQTFSKDSQPITELVKIRHDFEKFLEKLKKLKTENDYIDSQPSGTSYLAVAVACMALAMPILAAYYTGCKGFRL